VITKEVYEKFCLKSFKKCEKFFFFTEYEKNIQNIKRLFFYKIKILNLQILARIGFFAGLFYQP
jgi:hypothetical protein